MALLITDPVCIKLTADGDIDRSANRMQFVSGLAAVVQGVRVRMNLAAGEWKLNRDVGMPWLPNDFVREADAILGQPYNEGKIVALFRRPILATPGVRQVLLLRPSFDGATRTLSIRWAANTLFGDTPEDILQVES